MKEKLTKILELHKDRIKVETSELARDLRDAPKDSDSQLMLLESLSM